MLDTVPHIALPIRVIGSAYQAVEQDTADELVSNVAVICAFPLGSRVERPEFGIVQPELRDVPLPVLDIERTINAFEPRAEVTVTEEPYQPLDPLAGRLRVTVSTVSEEEL